MDSQQISLHRNLLLQMPSQLIAPPRGVGLRPANNENSGSGLTKAMQRRLSYTFKDIGSKGKILPYNGNILEPVWKNS